MVGQMAQLLNNIEGLKEILVGFLFLDTTAALRCN